jgi:hypothetical protein
LAYEFPDDSGIPEVESTEIDDAAREVTRRRPAVKETMFDEIARDLALWIDQTASEVALAFAPARSPFSAKITEEQKLEFYKTRLFNPDGSPNHQGRQQEIARLGPEGFGQVYKAVIAAYPELKPPAPEPIEVSEEWPEVPPGPAGSLPPGPVAGGPGSPPAGPVPPMPIPGGP